MRRVLTCGVLGAAILAPLGCGQSVSDQASFKTMSLGGLRLYGVSVFSGYSTSAYPGGLGQVPQLGAGQLGADANYGATASLGWQHHRERTDFVLLYSGTYGGMVRYSDANAFSQSMSVSVSRVLSPKWTFSLSGSGSDLTMAQFLYQPSSVGLVSQVSATVDDLAAAFSLGQFSSNQIASRLTGAPLLESPARSLLLGDRVLSYAAQTGLQYQYSSRLIFHLGSFAAGGQHRAHSSTVQEQAYIMPRSIGINAGIGMSYMLSPRTEVGLDLAANRVVNRYQSAYVTNATGSIGRRMGTHWFLTAHGGGAITRVIQQSYGTPQTRNLVGGGSIGFRTFRHSFVGTYERSSMDTFGLAIGTTTALSAGWSWHRPGRRWTMFTSFGQQEIRNTGYARLSGWEASGGVTQRLNSNTQLTAEYVYLSNTGIYPGSISNNLAIHSVRLSVSWAPQAVAR